MLVTRTTLSVLLAALAVAACSSEEPPVRTPTIVTVTPVDVLPTPVPTAVTPSPTVAPPRSAVSPISYVRVALFGVSCPGGGSVPDNAQKQVPLGCKGAVTATPKKEDGTDVRSEDHGPDIAWDLVHGERLVDVKAIPNQPFNRDVIGQRPGPFMLCATVRDVMGCLNGEVTP
jgi:hypothetical protein